MPTDKFSSIALPSTTVGGVIATYDRHHAVSQTIFNTGFRDLFDELRPFGFDGDSWASNGIPLPNTLPGANAMGMAAHIDSHPAYVAWQRELFADLANDMSDGNFGGLSQAQWLQQVANQMNGFSA